MPDPLKYTPQTTENRVALKVAAIYAAAGGAWIALSDRILALLVPDPGAYALLQTVKGWLFVLVTAAVLFFLVRRYTLAVRRRDAALQSIVTGVSGDVGVDFFKSLVTHLATAIGLDYALVAELADRSGGRARTVALWGDGEIRENIEYPLAATPCAEVLTGDVCCHPGKVREAFPDDALLEAMGVESYIGTPLRDSTGTSMGLMVLMSRTPLAEPQMAESLLRVFAVRAATELERKRTEDTLRGQFAEISTIFDSLNALVYVADLETYQMLYLNRCGEELFGSDWAGRPCYKVLQAGQEDPCDFCTNDRLVRDGEPQPPYVWEFQNTVTRRWFQCIDRAIRWPDGRLVRLEIAIDISERKEMERLKDDMLSAVSHEMRTPLTAIIGYTDLLLETALSPEQQRESLVTLDKEAHRLHKLIDDFLDLQRFRARQGEQDFEPVNIPALLEDAARGHHSACPGHPLSLECPGGLPQPAGTPRLLIQALGNLLSNACKHSPPGGAITLSARRQGEELVLAVRDEGPGVPAESLGRVFERFYRVDSGDRRATGGAGLGLALVKEIALFHGGRAGAESPPGGGSTFFVALPLPADN